MTILAVYIIGGWAALFILEKLFNRFITKRGEKEND